MKKAISWILTVCLLFLIMAFGAEPSAGYDISDTSSPAGQEESSASSDATEPSATAENSSEMSEPSESGKEGSVVYFTSNISPEGMLAVFEAPGWTPTGNVAVKLSTGEPPASNYLRPELIKNVVDTVNGTIVKCNNISIDCDCDGNPAEPDIHDIGILASTDPVAIDQASIDLCFAAEGSESLQQRVERQNGLHTLEHAEEIGLGSRTYDLVNIDG